MEPYIMMRLTEDDIELLIDGVKMIKGEASGYCDVTMHVCEDMLDRLSVQLQKVKEKCQSESQGT